MILVAPLRRHGSVLLWLALGLAAAGGVSPATAGGIHPEIGLAVNGLAGAGDFREVSMPCMGAEAVAQLANEAGGLGVRVAGGMHLLRGYKVPTGELIFNGTGTQEGKFEAKQSLWWVAIGPAWTEPLGSGRLNVYLMAGRGLTKASSSGAWIDTQGEDPGTTQIAIVRAGAAWSPAVFPVEIGLELLTGGRADLWGNPPATADSAGHHVLQTRSAAVTGAVLRLGFQFEI